MPNHVLNNTNYHSINIYLNSQSAIISNSDANKVFALKNPVFAFSNTKIDIFNRRASTFFAKIDVI